MATKFVWVKNNHHSSVKVRVNAEIDGVRQDKIIEFERERINRQNQTVESNGYTKITQDDYDLFYAGSKVFKAFIDDKTFTVYAEPPEDAFTDAQRVSMLETEKTALQGEIAELGAQLQAAKEANSGKDLSIELAALQAEFDAYKIAHPDTSAEFAEVKTAGVSEGADAQGG
jgi:hypothetical protein